MTYLWQEERGQKFYRVQTDEKEVAEKLKRRNGFKLSGWSINGHSLWIFACTFTRPDIAKKVLKSVTGQKSNIDSEGLISFGRSISLN
ncbi:MAG: hypothetical protein GYA14_09375 [Ignavibacteria bacterium]|nr:hypothetical protein [Ignavibacteria bacterium]